MSAGRCGTALYGSGRDWRVPAPCSSPLAAPRPVSPCRRDQTRRPLRVARGAGARGESASGKAGEFVIEDGLVEPVEALVVELAAAMQRAVQGESLVEIDHQQGFVTDCLTNSFDRGDIIGEPVAAEAQLQPLE